MMLKAFLLYEISLICHAQAKPTFLTIFAIASARNFYPEGV